jgi:hypothetical protein
MIDLDTSFFEHEGLLDQQSIQKSKSALSRRQADRRFSIDYKIID